MSLNPMFAFNQGVELPLKSRIPQKEHKLLSSKNFHEKTQNIWVPLFQDALYNADFPSHPIDDKSSVFSYLFFNIPRTPRVSRQGRTESPIMSEPVRQKPLFSTPLVRQSISSNNLEEINEEYRGLALITDRQRPRSVLFPLFLPSVNQPGIFFRRPGVHDRRWQVPARNFLGVERDRNNASRRLLFERGFGRRTS